MTTDPTPDPAPVCGQSTPSADNLRTRPAFDYGEPWKAVTYRDGGAITRHGQPIMEAFGLVKRAITCVNACAGMADPADQFAELKRERDEALDQLTALQIQVKDIVRQPDFTNPELMVRALNDALAKLQPFSAPTE